MKILLVPDTFQWVLGDWARQIARFDPANDYFFFSDLLYTYYAKTFDALANRVDAVHFFYPYQLDKYSLPGRKARVVNVNHVVDWKKIGRVHDADRILFMSGEWQRYLLEKGIDAGRLVRFQTAANREIFSDRLDKGTARKRFGLPPDAFVIGMFCKHESNEADRKGIRTFLELVEILIARRRRPHILLAGPGWQGVVETIRRRGLTIHYFPFLDHRRDMPWAYRALDIHLVLSKIEGGPITLLEAMFCAVPTIITPVGFAPEIVRPGVNGYLVEKNDAQAVASLLAHLMDNRAKTHEMGRRARRDAMAMPGWKDLLKGFGTVYESAAKDAALRSAAMVDRGAPARETAFACGPFLGRIESPRPAAQRQAAQFADAVVWYFRLVKSGHREEGLRRIFHLLLGGPLTLPRRMGFLMDCLRTAAAERLA